MCYPQASSQAILANHIPQYLDGSMKPPILTEAVSGKFLSSIHLFEGESNREKVLVMFGLTDKESGKIIRGSISFAFCFHNETHPYLRGSKYLVSQRF